MKLCICILGLLINSLIFLCSLAIASERPNVVLIVADDMGYADLGVQGARGFRTPHLDQLAAEGTRFTSYYVAQAVCTASRAALMTGCYPNRIGMQGAFNHTSRDGIADSEWLLPEMFKDRGYTTACFGKWHLGTRPRFSPLRHGFDEWFGIPYSNDNSKYHPTLAKEMPALPLYDGENINEYDPDQSQFTRRLTIKATDFIDRNKSKPFFLYVPHVMPHVPIFASDAFRGRSQAGLYGDVMEELDWSVGEILASLKRNDLDEKTLVIFVSDNGPFLSYGDHAGSANPLREGKLTTFEGGVRVPCLVRWPGHVPAGRLSDEPFVGTDWLPTLTELVGGKTPSNKIDGRSVKNLLFGDTKARSPHEAIVFYSGTALQAVRYGRFKLHFPHPYITPAGEPGRSGKPSNWGNLSPTSIVQSGVEGIATRHGYRIEQIEMSLFDLEKDPGERTNVVSQHPEIVRKINELAERFREELGDSLLGIEGRGLRTPGEDVVPIQVKNDSELRRALRELESGATLLIASGEYGGGFELRGVANVTIEGADPLQPPLFRGGANAFHFSRCPNLAVRNLRVTQQTGNGLNIDDGGGANEFVSGLQVENLEVSEIGPKGNCDGIKCSGIRDFRIKKCSFSGWAGQGIDCVGCHEGEIVDCRFEGKSGFTPSASVQIKGGSSKVTVKDCTFLQAGERGINAGGSTGLAYFRPRESKWEASQITIENNRFEGGLCAIAFVGVNNCMVRNNTILFPAKWIFRTLQENREPGFRGSQMVTIENNRIIFTRKDVSIEVNVGTGTQLEELSFFNNHWYADDFPKDSKPRSIKNHSSDSFGTDPR